MLLQNNRKPLRNQGLQYVFIFESNKTCFRSEGKPLTRITLAHTEDGSFHKESPESIFAFTVLQGGLSQILPSKEADFGSNGTDRFGTSVSFASLRGRSYDLGPDTWNEKAVSGSNASLEQFQTAFLERANPVDLFWLLLQGSYALPRDKRRAVSKAPESQEFSVVNQALTSSS